MNGEGLLPAHGSERQREHAILGPPDSAREIEFTFDGQPIVAREGEPIAAALIAAGIRVFRTMPERGDPRGGYCMVGRCADCQIILDGVPGVPACVTPAAPGVIVQTRRGLGEDGWDLYGEAGP